MLPNLEPFHKHDLDSESGVQMSFNEKKNSTNCNSGKLVPKLKNAVLKLFTISKEKSRKK